MANPTPGTVEYAYNRVYIVVDPSAPSGPPTYRVSNPDEIPGTGGGTTYDFDAVAPINVNDTPGVGGNPNRVVTSMDIQQLTDR
jgi:hypothetical protein